MSDIEKLKLDGYLAALGVGPSATVTEVKKSARALFLKYHPDLNPGNRARCEEKTRLIIEAYKTVLALKEMEAKVIVETPGGAAESFDVVAFDIANCALAAPTSFVREIVRVADGAVDDIGFVSDAFPYVAGAFRRGGEVSLLWNLHRQLGLREGPISSDFRKKKVIVAVIDDSPVSFIVDGVRGIMTLGRDSLISSGEAFGFDAAYLDGCIKTEDAEIGLLNLRNVIYGKE